MATGLKGKRATLVGKGSTLNQTAVAGAAADTNIAVTGITLKDALVSVIESAAGALTDRTAQCSITSNGNIQCTVDTTGDSLLVLWMGH